MKNIFLSIILVFCVLANLNPQTGPLKRYRQIKTPFFIYRSYYLLENQKVFYLYHAGCVVGKMSFAFGMGDVSRNKNYYEFALKSINEYHAVKTYKYSQDTTRRDLRITVIGINNDTLNLNDIYIGKGVKYKLKDKRIIKASTKNNEFDLPNSTNKTHLALTGMYKYWQHDVIFPLPNEGDNHLTIWLNVPLEFYIHDYKMYQQISIVTGTLQATFDDWELKKYSKTMTKRAFYTDSLNIYVRDTLAERNMNSHWVEFHKTLLDSSFIDTLKSKNKR